MLNDKYRYGETSQQQRDRLEREASAEVTEHKHGILTALFAAGAQVKPPQDLTIHERWGETWVINDQPIYLRTSIVRTGSFFSYRKPNGQYRFAVEHGPWKDQFCSRKGNVVDYAGIAKSFVAIAGYAKEKKEHETRAREERDEQVVAAWEVATEFGLKPAFEGPSVLPAPFDGVSPSGIDMKFSGLTKAQARAILTAAKACGALDAEDE